MQSAQPLEPPSGDVSAHAATETAQGTAKLGLWDAVSIIIGIVIGAGIYETSPLVMQNVGGPLALFAVWALGGVLSLIGAACYAELASTYPRSGGDYVYLSRAFAPFVGFMFGWAQLAVILTGSIGMMAYVFADYAAALFLLGETRTTLLAASSVILLTALNLGGVAFGKKAQNILSWLKVIGIALVVIAGIAFRGSAAAPAAEPMRAASDGSFGLAMILVLYTFGGWNDAAYVAAEVRDRRRNLPRALVLGTAAVTLIYLLMNVAFVAGLGFAQARSSQAIAADMLGAALGSGARAVISLLVMISALGAVNALIFTGSRVYATVGADYGSLSLLGRWSPRLGSPVWSLSIQLLVTLAMIVLVGTARGRGVIDGALVGLGWSPAVWTGHGGFDTLLRCSAPVFWLFFLLTSLALFVLRARDAHRPRPFRVPLYPLLPLLFSATCLYMLYSSVKYAGKLTLIGVLPLLVGIPFYCASKRRPKLLAARSDPLASGAE